jgi:DNA-binding CsgD family transcriptional regulator
MYLARHRELGDIKSPLHRSQDPRLSAFFGYSTAVTELALGNKKRGLSDLRDALDAFERVGYEWRTARCLIAEYAVTAEEALLATAAERLRNYGQSWLARELRSLKSSSRRIDLPPMKRRVFEEACLGKSIPEIAKVLGKSEYTISNHMKEIFKAFNVSSRSQLMAEAARRGLLGGS